MAEDPPPSPLAETLTDWAEDQGGAAGPAEPPVPGQNVFAVHVPGGPNVRGQSISPDGAVRAAAQAVARHAASREDLEPPDLTVADEGTGPPPR